MTNTIRSTISRSLSGCYTALITPFRDDLIDETALRALVRRQIVGGVSGLVPCGTTGEAPTLSPSEWDRIVSIVVETSDGRVPVLAGTGRSWTSQGGRTPHGHHRLRSPTRKPKRPSSKAQTPRTLARSSVVAKPGLERLLGCCIGERMAAAPGLQLHPVLAQLCPDPVEAADRRCHDGRQDRSGRL